jgi:hypothetical protein
VSLNGSAMKLKKQSFTEPEVFVPIIMADIFADKWVKETCLRRLAHAEQNRSLLPPQRPERDPFEASRAGINSKAFLPCLRQLYLLANAPFDGGKLNQEVVRDLSENGKYRPAEKLRSSYIEYNVRRLPLPSSEIFCHIL